jgi:hypothetical protein
MSVKKLFGMKAPSVKAGAVPQSPTAGTEVGNTPQLNYQSLISTSAGGLKRKSTTAKRSILGGA